MKVSEFWPGGVLLMIVLGAGIYLFLNEQRYRRHLPPVPVSAPTGRPTADTSFAPNTKPLLTALGLTAQAETRQSASPVTVHGIFATSDGASRALLTVAGTSGSYKVGERLPDGGLLRGIEPDRVLLWRNGQETLLPLTPDRQRPSRAATPSQPRHLLPMNVLVKGEK